MNNDFLIHDGVLIKYFGYNKDIVVPEGVVEIEDSAFRFEINEYLFEESVFYSITLPSTIKKIGYLGAETINRLNFKGSIDEWLNISFNGKISDYWNLYINDSKVSCVSFPNTFKEIKPYMFYGCSSLKSITIPNSVTSIGDYAFRSCRGLTSVTIPSSVTSIGESAFYDCRGLASINIPDSVTSIGESSFCLCSELEFINLSNSLTNIGDGAFYCCEKSNFNEYDNALYLGNKDNPYLYLVKAKSHDIPSCIINSNCKFICFGAFYHCRNLESINIPNSVISVSRYAITECENLKSVIVSNPSTKLDGRSFDYRAKVIRGVQFKQDQNATSKHNVKNIHKV